jgi:uncharacterized phage-like protein YoqJ
VHVSVIAVTGHRPDAINSDYTYTTKPWQNIKTELAAVFTEQGATRIITGMALGVDTVAAQVAQRLYIPYTAAVPFKGQENRWPESSKVLYRALLANADEVVYVSPGGYAGWKMHRRNAYMVDRAARDQGLLTAVWNGDKKGGTWGCLQYAFKEKLPVWRIKPYYFEREREVGWLDEIL